MNHPHSVRQQSSGHPLHAGDLLYLARAVGVLLLAGAAALAGRQWRVNELMRSAAAEPDTGQALAALQGAQRVASRGPLRALDARLYLRAAQLQGPGSGAGPEGEQPVSEQAPAGEYGTDGEYGLATSACGNPSQRRQPETRVTLLAAAVGENPYATGARIELGLALEAGGDLEAAERQLLEAARHDRQWLPAWTLANFYFRRGAEKPFWRWARQAAGRSFDDYRPLLGLADRLEPDPALLLQRLAADAPLSRAYLDFLIGRDRLADAAVAARHLRALGDPGDPAPSSDARSWSGRSRDSSRTGRSSPGRSSSGQSSDDARLRDLSDRYLRAGQPRLAREFWPEFGAGSRARLGRANAGDGGSDPGRRPARAAQGLANADLATRGTGQGFDWNLPACPGVSRFWEPGRIRWEWSESFPGRPASGCTLFEQIVPTEPGHSYRLEAGWERREDRRRSNGTSIPSDRTSRRSAPREPVPGLYWLLEEGDEAGPGAGSEDPPRDAAERNLDPADGPSSIRLGRAAGIVSRLRLVLGAGAAPGSGNAASLRQLRLIEVGDGTGSASTDAGIPGTGDAP